MKSSTITLSALLVAAVAYAGYLQTELNRLKTGPAEGAPPLVAETVGEAETEEIAQEPEAESTPSDEAVAVVEEAPAPPPRGGDRQARRAERMKQMLAAFEDPEMRVDMIERQMNRVDSRFAGFFKTLDLSPEELDTVRALMAEEGVVNWEMRMRGFGAETDEARDAAEADRERQRELIKDQIAAVLGEENSAALEDYSETLPFRGEVEGLASSLSFSDTPLTDVQGESLVSALRDVSQSFEYSVDLSEVRGRDFSGIDTADVAVYFDERAKRDEMVLEAAAESLSDEQLAAYAERQLAERERDRRQMEFMQENPGVGPGRGGPRGGGGPRP